MNNSIDSKEIAKSAWNMQNQYDKNTLLDMLVEEWSKVGDEDMPTLGELSDYLSGVAKRIAQGIVRNKDLAVATMGLITSEVVTFAISSGYDLDKYRLALAILVSLVTKAVLEELEVVLEE